MNSFSPTYKNIFFREACVHRKEENLSEKLPSTLKQKILKVFFFFFKVLSVLNYFAILQPFSQLNSPLQSFVNACCICEEQEGRKRQKHCLCYRFCLTILPSFNGVLFSYYNYLSVNDI